MCENEQPQDDWANGDRCSNCEMVWALCECDQQRENKSDDNPESYLPN